MPFAKFSLSLYSNFMIFYVIPAYASNAFSADLRGFLFPRSFCILFAWGFCPFSSNKNKVINYLSTQKIK